MSDPITALVNCPHCGKPVSWNTQSPYRPFCSERCRLIDLGAWANEDHRIPGQPAIPSEPDED